MNLRIVPIAENHVASFRECLDTVAREKKYLAQIEALPLERIKGFVRDSIANDVAQFVALDSERVVGWCDIFPHWAAAQMHCGTLGMGVLPAYRGRGIGRQLLTICIAKAHLRGITRIVLEAREDNSRAIGLYQKMGFCLETRTRKALRFDGEYYDGVQMSLVLEHAA